jgi:hypothetical protein
LGGNTHAWSGTSRRVGSRRVSSSSIGQDTRTPLVLIEYRHDVPFKFFGAHLN